MPPGPITKGTDQTMSTMTPTRRRPRPSRATQPTLRPIDFDAIRAEAARSVDAVLAGAGPDPVDRLHAVADLLNDAVADVKRLRPQVNQRVVSLAIYGGVRGLAKYVGISPQTFNNVKRDALGGPFGDMDKDQLLQRAKAVGVPHLPNALRELPLRTEKLARAAAVEAVAHPMRDDLVRELVTSERLSQAQVAAIIGVVPSRVNHMINPPKKSE